MFMVRGLFDRLLLVVGVLCGGTAPSFIAQHRQRIGGHLTQVSEDLAPFQQIADRYHQGSLNALVRHHLQSYDDTFRAEGAAIQAMIDMKLQLTSTYAALGGGLLQKLEVLLLHTPSGMLRATWNIYQPGFVFSIEGLLLAAGCGIALWLLFLGSWILCGRFIISLRHSLALLRK